MSDPIEPASYYFWKWADDDLPGPPREVHAALLRGELHPAIQPFDARALLGRLEEAAGEGRLLDLEWNWQVHPQGHPECALFVFVTCPAFVEHASTDRKQAIDRFFALGLSGCDAESGYLIDFMLPKLNCFESGQAPLAPVFDIKETEVAGLIQRLRMSVEYPYAKFTDKRNHYVQCLKYGHRFVIEWRQNHNISDLSKFDQWRAGYRPDVTHVRKFVPAGMGYVRQGSDADHYRETKNDDQELMQFTDTVTIFKHFLRGEPLPPQYEWKNINAELP